MKKYQRIKQLKEAVNSQDDYTSLESFLTQYILEEVSDSQFFNLKRELDKIWHDKVMGYLIARDLSYENACYIESYLKGEMDESRLPAILSFIDVIKHRNRDLEEDENKLVEKNNE